MLTILLNLTLAAALSWVEPTAVHPGQQGTCVTEWTGGQHWRIPVEVMGVLDASTPGGRAVLVRLTDDRFTDQGVVAGMSGSPVYVDGKLLGAVAFGWSFAREPLAGVTPFADMLQLRGGAAEAPPESSPVSLAALAAARVDVASLLPPEPASRGRLLPIPLAVSGLPVDPGAGMFQSIGLLAVPAGAGADIGGVPEGGDMVAALLVWGDATLAAGGTVTAREGDDVFAFGHPFLGLGTVALPAARARVVAVQRSYQEPFKVFTVGRPFGTFVTDRRTGMVARVGSAPEGLPVTIAVHDAAGSQRWNFRVARIPVLEPLMLTYLANASLAARGASAGEATVGVTVELTLEDGRRVSLSQATEGMDALARVSTFAGAVLGFVESSSFPHPPVRAVHVELTHRERNTAATIAEAIPARTTVHPGEELPVTVRLLPREQPPRFLRLTVKVPERVREGRLDLIVADGAAWSEYLLKAEGIVPATFDGQLDQLRMLRSSAGLVVALETREGGLAYPGASQPALPPSWAATLATGLGTSAVTRLRTAVVAAVHEASAVPLTGAFRIPLTVRAPLEETP